MIGRPLLTLAILLAATRLHAQTAQTVTFQVDAINQIAFTGSPSLVINSATPGSGPTNATAGATWGVTSNQTGSKITASINAAMPAGVTLAVALTAPSGATSAGAQSLGTTSVDVVTGITKVAQGALAVTYTLSATVAAGVVASATRTVTYTITGGHLTVNRTTLATVALLALLPLGSSAAFAQAVAVSGSPATLRVTSAVAGSEPIAVSDATTTYTVTTPAANRTYRITAQINANMPTGTTLNATLAAPPGAASVGTVALDATARNVVTGITRNTNATQGVTYQFVATAAAGVIPATTRTVTFTIVSP